jgi:ubiquinone biosynthesis protein COQ4
MTMTDTLPAPAANEPFRRPGIQWGAALKALQRLLADKEDTGQVFEIMRALNGVTNARNYARLLRTPAGGRLAYERVELAPRLMDDAWLDGFAKGTVGATYRDFVRSQDLSAQGLADVSNQGGWGVDMPHPYAWLGRRTRDVHDIWHILTGYDRDGLGEACLVAFSYAQTGGLGWAFIAVGVAARVLRADGWAHVRAIWQGYLLGRRADWLAGEDYVRLMGEPLDSARRRLRLAAPTRYQAISTIARDW